VKPPGDNEREDLGTDSVDFEPAQTMEPGLLGVVAARSVGILVGRTLGLQLLTAGVTIALAHLLTPYDYGLFAIALAVQMFGQRAAELGLPASLVRLEGEPSTHLQRSLSGAMLALACSVAGVAVLVAFAIVPLVSGRSEAVEIVAVCLLAMPFYAGRAVPMAMLERGMSFGRVAILETAETLTFNVFALTAALAGLGAYSLTAAVPAGAAVGFATAYYFKVAPRLPAFDLDEIRPLIGFGARITVLQAVYLTRELGFVLLLTAIGSAATAGFYAMAKRLFSLPIAVTSAVGRVSFPALSREREQGPERAGRIAATTALATALPMALVAGAAQPLIGVLLGDEWLPTSDIVVIGSLGMLIAAGALPPMISHDLANGEVTKPIAAATAEAVVLYLAAIFLLDPIGEAAIGIGTAASSILALFILAAGAHPVLRGYLPSVLRSITIATAAVGVGQLLDVENTLGGLAIAIAAVSATWLALELVFARSELRSAIALVRPMLKRS